MMRQVCSVAIVGGGLLTAACDSARTETAAPGIETPYPGPERVAIYRDEWGVPHVYAEEEYAGLYGAGYALAEDNLSNILRYYVAISGHAAAAFGEEYIESDVSALHWRIAEDARAAFPQLEPRIQANLRAFVAGIGRYMADHPGKVPEWAPELEPWLPVAATHSIVVAISVFQTGQGLSDCQLTDYTPVLYLSAARDSAITSSNLPMIASNQWVISPNRSATGVLINWADSHSPFDTERDEIRLHAGDLHVTGIVPAGFALPLIGHNRNIAWSFTVGGPDVSDCYTVTTSPEDPNRYRFDGAWRELITQTATIDVRDGEPALRKLEYTNHNGQLNPVIARRDGIAYVISTPHLGAAASGERTVYGMNRAKNIDAFIDALAHLGLFPENVMAGDRFGESFYISVGRTPRRPEGLTSDHPLDGNSSRTAWQGIHPIEDLVQLRNPATGWMQNNNIAPDTMIPETPIAAADYPAYIFNNQAGRTNIRAERAKVLLAKADKVDEKQAVALGMDQLWPYTPRWQQALTRAVERSDDAANLSPAAAKIMERLLTFDGIADKDSVAALNWYFWRVAVADRARQETADFEAMANTIQSGNLLSSEIDRLLISAVEDAATRLLKRYDSTALRLGDVFRIGRGSETWPLGGISIPAEAGFEPTLRAMRCRRSEDERTCLAGFGQRHPILTVFSDPLVSFSAVPFGQDSDPGSPHYSDQSALASDGILKPVHFEWSNLEPHVTSKVVLSVTSSGADGTSTQTSRTQR